MAETLRMARLEGAIAARWVVPRPAMRSLRREARQVGGTGITRILGLPIEIARTPDGKFSLLVETTERTD
ncbi:hypothetical protein WG908_12715 [Sphingobium sp. AN641]|uniref:hypothetical protein n=1 Tax=Sphingobium sp. AN641 TaxID=3133443 RepID=UPI0030BE2B7F